MHKKLVVLFGLLLFSGFAKAASLDSLKIKLGRAKNDSAKIEYLSKYAGIQKFSDKTRDSLLTVIKSYSGSKDCFINFFCFYKLGVYYAQNESPQKAISNLIIALQLADSCNNKRAIMLARNRLAFVNKINNNFKAAITNAHQSLSYARLFNDSLILADNYTLLGNIYKTDLLLDSALFYHNKALAIREVLGNENFLALTYNNLGLTYKNKRDYQKALYYLRKSFSLKRKLKDNTIASSYNNLSIVFRLMKLYDSSVIYSLKNVEISVKQKSSKSLNEGLMSLAETYDEMKNSEKALYYYKRLHDTEDSVKKETITTQYQELQSKYESDKKDSELRLKEDAINLAEAQNAKKNILIIFSFIALSMAIIAGIFIYRSYIINKKSAIKLLAKNSLIEEKNKEITDSINYARNIQHSLLTSEDLFKENLKEHFILFLPKDIVSGDFYWARKIEEGFLVMCADCTGHGVPGAFMSLLGISHLNDTTNNIKLQRPNWILNELRKRFIESFALTNNKDGMDASLVLIQNNTLYTAAANNAIWLIRNKTNQIIQANKFPIGKHYGEIQDFTLNTLELEKNDLLIMFTDGYADQFGGVKNKKYKYKRLEEKIIENSDLPLSEIKMVLTGEIKSWMGVTEQVDDILLIGIRI